MGHQRSAVHSILTRPHWSLAMSHPLAFLSSATTTRNHPRDARSKFEDTFQRLSRQDLLQVPSHSLLQLLANRVTSRHPCYGLQTRPCVRPRRLPTSFPSISSET